MAAQLYSHIAILCFCVLRTEWNKPKIDSSMPKHWITCIFTSWLWRKQKLLAQIVLHNWCDEWCERISHQTYSLCLLIARAQTYQFKFGSESCEMLWIIWIWWLMKNINNNNNRLALNWYIIDLISVAGLADGLIRRVESSSTFDFEKESQFLLESTVAVRLSLNQLREQRYLKRQPPAIRWDTLIEKCPKKWKGEREREADRERKSRMKQNKTSLNWAEKSNDLSL